MLEEQPSYETRAEGVEQRKRGERGETYPWSSTEIEDDFALFWRGKSAYLVATGIVLCTWRGQVT